MNIMLRIIVETTHLVISQYAHDATNNGRVHTSTYITIMSIYAHAFSGKPGKKKKKTIARRLSSGGRLREQIQHFFLLFSPSIHLLQYADLAQPERRALCELVGTLNV